MKHLLLTFFILFYSHAYCQTVVFADPSLGQLVLATNNNNNFPSNPTASLAMLQDYILKVPIKNLGTTGAIPLSTTRIKIGLGSKLVLAPDFTISNTNTSNLFNWSAVNSGGQIQITGDLIAPLPELYNDTTIFYVRGSILGASTITANFLVSNNDPMFTLSDDDGTNNLSSLPYVITQAVPVNFKEFLISRESCNIDIRFSTENEINLKQYNIEYSYNGITYEKAATLLPNITNNYFYKLSLSNLNTGQQIYIRIKSIDLDGSFQVSNIKSIFLNCDHKKNYTFFPNPLMNNESNIFIKNVNGKFNGKYKVSMYNSSGKLIVSNDAFSNSSLIKFNIPKISKGIFIINVIDLNTSETIFTGKLMK